jgi:hypothetical protein
MERLSAALVQYTGQHKAELYKSGRWTFPSMVLVNAAREHKLGDDWLRDGWGQAIKLVQVANKAANKTGHSQFDEHDLISAGPDRDFQTRDDLSWRRGGKELDGGWWSQRSDERLVQLKQGFPRGRLGDQLGRGGVPMEQLRRMAGGMDRNALRELAAAPAPFGAPGAMPAAKEAAPMKAARAEAKAEGGPGTGGGGGEAPITRVREYFPETMLWQPALITDDKGVADLAVNFADSITTWRLSASASSRGGALGGVTAPLKVFQDFFVDIDLPVTLTQHDEVAFPVAVYNYLKTPQTVTLQLEAEPWFTLLDQGGLTRKLDLQPDQVTSVKFRIKADKIGNQPLTVKARGSKLSDAVKRVVEVVPNGQKFEKVVNDRLSGKVAQTIEIPPGAIPDASKLLVRIYPGVVAQVLEGTEGMLRLPGG